jgi:hypothetical protein
LDELKFVSTTSGNYFGPALDDVSLTPTPEPCTLALLSGGVFGMFRYGRRRRRQD